MISAMFPRLALRMSPLPLRRPFSALANPVPRRPIPFRMQSPARILVRGAASAVSGRPGSQTVEQARTNIKEEVTNSAADIAKSIAGVNVFVDGMEPTKRTFFGITSLVAHEIPTPYLVTGLMGTLPYVGTAATTIYLARQAGAVATAIPPALDPGVAITYLDQVLSIQTTYGAVMLSFLGAMHWGMEFAGYGGHKYYPRLMLGIAPVAFGWYTLALDPMYALMAQWLGFVAMWYADLTSTNWGWSPKWYALYRFYLSLIVGGSIIATLAGTSYWGPVGGHGFISHDLDVIREEREKTAPKKPVLVAGEYHAHPAPEESDHYVIVHKKQEDEPE